MSTSYTTQIRNDRLNVIRDAIDIGTAGTLRIYDGVKPADANTALAGQTLLSEHLLTTVSAPNAAAALLTFNAIADDISAIAGTAAWFRIVTSAAAATVDGDAGLSGSGKELILNSLAFTLGINVAVDSLTIAAGNA